MHIEVRQLPVLKHTLLFFAFTLLLQGPCYAAREIDLTDQEKQWLQKHPVVRVGVGIAFPPYMWVEEKDGEYVFQGMVSDYLSILSKLLGVEMDIVYDAPFNQALKMGENREIDFFPCLSKNAKRNTFLNFTQPYLNYPLVVITREDAPIIGSLNDLQGKRFATVKHLIVYSTLRRDYDFLDLSFVFTSTVDENLEEVSMGQADACIINLAAASYFIQKKGLTNLKIAAPLNWEGVQYSMGVRNDWPVFQTIIEKSLAAIAQEQKDAISDKWIKVLYKPGLDVGKVISWAIFAFCTGIMLFAFFYFWNRRLQKEIEKRKETQAALEENRRMRATLIGNLQGMAYRCFNDENWTMVYISNGCQAITGYTPEDLLYNRQVSFKKLILKEDRQYVWNSVQKSIEKKEPFSIEYRIQTRTKGKRWVYEKGMVIHDENENTSFIEGFISDITEKKEAEKKVLSEKVKAERYLELASVMFVGLDATGIITLINPEACKVLEGSKTEIIGKNWFNTFLPENEREAVQSYFKRLMSGNDHILMLHENIIVTLLGNKRHIAWNNNIIKENGFCIGLLSCGRDITEQRKLRKQLEQSQKMEAIGTLAGGIAHDFNNILAAILGYTELSLDEAKDNELLNEYLSEIYRGSLRAKELVKQILTFARKDDEKSIQLFISDILDENLKFIRSTIPTSVSIETVISSKNWVAGAPTYIHQVLMNLCSNSVHAMGEKGGKISIRCTDLHFDSQQQDFLGHTVEAGDYVLLEIKDNGQGISNTEKSAIFEPYYTTKSQEEGTGLGLSVVYGIVQKMDGFISVDSRLGEWTIFTLLFPAVIHEETKQPEKQQTTLQDEPTHILFVDDEKAIAKLAKKMLEGLGFSVTTCTSSEEAYNLFKQEPMAIDLLITDMTMPYMTGEQLASQVKAIRPDLGVLLCTGYNSSIQKEDTLPETIDALCYKPFKKEELAATVQKLLHNNP